MFSIIRKVLQSYIAYLDYLNRVYSRYAKVFVSIIGNDTEAESTIEGLNNAKGYIRGLLGKNLYLRYVPDLNFQKDESSEKLDKISRLLGKINDGGNS